MRLHYLLGDADVNSDMTNVFKTPGKMKGKTPRTNRKRNAAETRIVSTSAAVFGSN